MPEQEMNPQFFHSNKEAIDGGFIGQCSKCGDWFFTNRKQTKKCSFCKKRKAERNAFYQTNAWRQIRREVLVRDNCTCQYCGKPADRADHVKPREHGGKTEMSNLKASCNPCNLRKNNILLKTH